MAIISPASVWPVLTQQAHHTLVAAAKLFDNDFAALEMELESSVYIPLTMLETAIKDMDARFARRHELLLQYEHYQSKV